MIPSVTNQHTDQSKKRGKSTSADLQVVHDHTNNSYHSSLYRHQVQSRQQNDRSAKTSITTFNENASCHSPAPPLKKSSSQTSTAAATTAVPSQQHSTLPYHPLTTSSHDITDDTNYGNTSVDFRSLHDAMGSSSSIDITTTHLHQHDTRDSLDTMLSYLCKYDELDQHINTLDQIENVSFLRVMYLGIASSEERRLFLKKLSDGLSETLLCHAPTTLAHHILVPSTNCATDSNIINMTPPCSYRFCERKHHLLPLGLFLTGNMNNDDSDNDNDDDNGDDHGYSYTAMFEDNEVSIVEADFTTDNNDSTIDPLTRHQQNLRHDPELILHYIYTQCQQNHSSSTLNAILNPSLHWGSQRFSGRVFSDAKSNGIDICVYFYHDAQDMAQVSEDMKLLWKISTLGIPILPIMSMSQQIPPSSPLQTAPSSTSTTPPALLSPNTRQLTRMTNSALSPSSQNHPFGDYVMKLEEGKDDDSNTSALYLTQRPIDVRRNELAHLFSLWRIKMMDISNLDMIGQPSFQSKGKSRWNSTHEDMIIEKLLGPAWTSSSLISPTPYHVLTFYQFMAIDRWAISRLLMAIKDQSKNQRQNLDGDSGSAAGAKDDHPTSHTASTSTLTSSSSSSASKTIITVQEQKEVPTSRPSSSHPSKFQLLPLLHVPTTYIIWLLLFVLLVYGLWIALTGLSCGLLSLVAQHRQASTWHASLIMVSHQRGKSMVFIVNVYDGQDQPKWAPELPLIATNMPLPITPLTSSASSSCTRCRTTTISSYSSIFWTNDPSSFLPPITVMPLPNKTRRQSLEGQYFYFVPLPLCSSLDTTVDYYVQVKPSTFLPSSKPGIVQGSPLHIPKLVLCGDSPGSTMADSSLALSWMDNTQEINNIKEAWGHFKQHSRFYLMNSFKIIEMMFTEGKDKD